MAFRTCACARCRGDVQLVGDLRFGAPSATSWTRRARAVTAFAARAPRTGSAERRPSARGASARRRGRAGNRCPPSPGWRPAEPTACCRWPARGRPGPANRPAGSASAHPSGDARGPSRCRSRADSSVSRPSRTRPLRTISGRTAGRADDSRIPTPKQESAGNPSGLSDLVRRRRAGMDRRPFRPHLYAGATPVVVWRSLAGRFVGLSDPDTSHQAVARWTARVSGVGWVRLANHPASGGRRGSRSGPRLRSLLRSGGAARVPPRSPQAQLSRPRRNRSRCRRDRDKARDWCTRMGIAVVAIQLEPAS
jgi:hypothetical protein